MADCEMCGGYTPGPMFCTDDCKADYVESSWERWKKVEGWLKEAFFKVNEEFLAAGNKRAYWESINKIGAVEVKQQDGGPTLVLFRIYSVANGLPCDELVHELNDLKHYMETTR